MKREELLTKLAKQVGQWPNGMLARVEEDGTHRFYWARVLVPDGGYVFGFDDWLAERKRLRQQEWPEERIDIVSLNGATGDHYPQSSGGDNDYWVAKITDPKRLQPYQAECEDIIEYFQMTFQEGEAFKALWRNGMLRLGMGKPGDTSLRNAEKVSHFGDRMIAMEKRKEATQ